MRSAFAPASPLVVAKAGLLPVILVVPLDPSARVGDGYQGTSMRTRANVSADIRPLGTRLLLLPGDLLFCKPLPFMSRFLDTDSTSKWG